MIDKKQVMFDMRCISHVPDACRDCSEYRHWSGNAVTCMECLMADALALLKKKEAKPILGFADIIEKEE